MGQHRWPSSLGICPDPIGQRRRLPRPFSGLQEPTEPALFSAGRRRTGETGIGTRLDYERSGSCRTRVATGGRQGMPADYYKRRGVPRCVPAKGVKGWRMPAGSAADRPARPASPKRPPRRWPTFRSDSARVAHSERRRRYRRRGLRGARHGHRRAKGVEGWRMPSWSAADWRWVWEPIDCWKRDGRPGSRPAHSTDRVQ